MLKYSTIILLFFPMLLIGQDSLYVSNYGIDKGRSFVTLTFSLDARNSENEEQLLRDVIDQNRLTYGITVAGGYVVTNNLALGCGFNYGREREDITFINSDGVQVESKFIGQQFQVSPIMRNYIPIGKGVVQILVQTNLDLTIGEALERRYFPTDQEKINEDYFEIGLGVSPGLLIFFDRHWAFELLVGLAGLQTNVSTLTVNDDVENETRIVESSIDLRINLLQLNLGVAYYF